MRGKFFDTASNHEGNWYPILPRPCPTGPEILKVMPDDDGGLFGFADLKSAYDYMRAGKGLDLPKHWKIQDGFLLPPVLPPRTPFVSRRSSSILIDG